MNEKKIKECVNYFEANKTLRKLLDGFVKKYASLGCVGGSVVLGNLKQTDIETLEGMFAKNYHGMHSATISAVRLQKVIDCSRFAGVSLEEVLSCYYKGPLKSNREEEAQKDKASKEFFLELVAGYPGSFAGDWLMLNMNENTALYHVLLQKLKAGQERLGELLSHVLAALNELPVHSESYEYMAVFATRITGNPHYFDEKEEAYYLLWQGILFYCERNASEYVAMQENSFKLDQKKEILYQVGLIRDEISNSTVVYGIQAKKKNGESHRGIEGFYLEREPVHLTLLTVAELQQVWCNSNVIYVVENPSVFASIVKVAEQKGSCLCVSGQPGLASLILMDKIAQNGGKIYYSGDCDPEGLCIADRMKRRYGASLELWLMEEEFYLQSISNKGISERRLKMLDGLQDSGLQGTAQRMRCEKKAGYQERIMEAYLESLGAET